ncbi:MAG: hypothetical protein ACYTFW_04120 [Planctomycetota bacterium]
MNSRNNKTSRQGAALLVVLFIVMVITILSVGFLSRSDVELACGENMILRTQMDYLAESGLEHARGLILNPQDVDTEYWAGATVQQLVADSGNYYDLEVVRDESDPTDLCNYIIDCNSYRLKGGEKIGRSRLRGKLRLDPCIAYWAGTNANISNRITVNGDIYCDGNLSGNGYVGGDVFASGSITGTNIAGQKSEAVVETPVDWPGIDINDFSLDYYIDSASYSVEVIDPNISNVTFGPSVNNPAGIHYCNDPNNLVNLNGNVTINGTLVVNGDLTINGTSNVISAGKNFPALLVSGEVIIEDGGTLQVKGLAQIGRRIAVSAGAQNIDIDGVLFIANGSIEGSASSSITIDITAAPSIASIQTWPAVGTARRWIPAAGAFYRSIERR